MKGLMMDENRVTQAIEELKKVEVARVVATLTDGSERKLKLSKSRNKWQSLRKTLGELDWCRLEAFDADDDLTLTLGPDDELAEFDDSALAAAADRNLRTLAGLQRLMLDAQDVALKRQAETTGRLFDAAVQLVDVLTTQVQTLATMWQRNVVALQDAATTAATDDLDPIVAEIIKTAAPQVAPIIVGRVAGALAKPTPATKPNGTPDK